MRRNNTVDAAGRNVSDTSCLTREKERRDEMLRQLGDNATDDDVVSDVYCLKWAAPVLLGIYLLIANVLLLNLLIAIFR